MLLFTLTEMEAANCESKVNRDSCSLLRFIEPSWLIPLSKKLIKICDRKEVKISKVKKGKLNYRYPCCYSTYLFSLGLGLELGSLRSITLYKFCLGLYNCSSYTLDAMFVVTSFKIP